MSVLSKEGDKVSPTVPIIRWRCIMFTFTKEEAELAAKQFCYAIEIWADCFVGSNHDFQELEENAEGVYLFNKKTDKRLSESRFLWNVSVIYDFSQTGIWNGENIFEDRDCLEDELMEPLTELSAFCEIFDHGHVNFHNLSGNDLMGVTVAGESIITILSDVISMAFARFSLISGGVLELEKLAMLADVSLKTVRNAVSSKSPNRIVLSDATIDGKPCVDADEALRWLENKKGYTGPLFVNELPAYKTYNSLGQLQYHCLSLMKNAAIDWDELKKRTSWNDNVIDAYQNLTKLKVNEGLSHITPMSLNTFGKIYKVSNLELFVKEGSKIVASTVAEYQANKLFA